MIEISEKNQKGWLNEHPRSISILNQSTNIISRLRRLFIVSYFFLLRREKKRVTTNTAS